MLALSDWCLDQIKDLTTLLEPQVERARLVPFG
jgi:hypothetical protein